MKKASLVGLMEAYHEHLGVPYARGLAPSGRGFCTRPRSYCLFHGKLLGSLPEHCNCKSSAWQSYVPTKDAHGERLPTRAASCPGSEATTPRWLAWPPRRVDAWTPWWPWTKGSTVLRWPALWPTPMRRKGALASRCCARKWNGASWRASPDATKGELRGFSLEGVQL